MFQVCISRGFLLSLKKRLTQKNPGQTQNLFVDLMTLPPFVKDLLLKAVPLIYDQYPT